MENAMIRHRRGAKYKVTSFWGAETNASANADTCWDGGGYFQPAGGCVLAVSGYGNVVVEYGDFSCGDFGSREHWAITAPNGDHWFVSMGTMSDCSSDEDVAGFLYAIRHRMRLEPEQMLNTVRKAVDMAAYRMPLLKEA